MAKPSIGYQTGIASFIYLEARSLTLRQRLLLAISVLLTPLTLIFMGRSIAVHYTPEFGFRDSRSLGEEG